MAAKKKRPSGGIVVLLIVLIAAAGYLFFTKMNVLNSITVDGVTRSERDRIVSLLGLEAGKDVSSVNLSEVRRIIRQDGAYEVLACEMRTGGNLYLDLRGRVARAKIKDTGMLYIIDEYGQVMAKYAAGDAYSEGKEYSLLDVTGLEIHGAAAIGSELPAADQNQVIAVSTVIRAMDSTGLYSLVTELNVQDLNNIYMTTVYGYFVEFGDSGKAENKCNIISQVIADLRQEGRYGGSIDATSGESAVYKPS